MSYLDDGHEWVGAVLNRRWQVLRAIGAGGLARVFEVAPVGGEGRFAAKLMRAEFCGEADLVSRFVAEAQVSSRLDHPGVPRIFEAAVAEDGTPYLVMELLQGEALSSLMSRGRLAIEVAVRVTREVLDVLDAAHRVGIVHRDLKPDNVFIARHPSGNVRACVLDFGLARVMDAAGGLARRTRTGMMLGTPGYMSPEQVQTAKHAGVPADLWAVGVILYEMLTGVHAFPAENEFERITKILSSDPAPIDKCAPQYAHWGGFFSRALARDPVLRFQSAREMEAAMNATERGERAAPSLGPTASNETLARRASAPPTAASFAVSAVPQRQPTADLGLAATLPLEDPVAARAVRFGADTKISPGASSVLPPESGGDPRVQVVAQRAPGIPVLLALAIALVTWLIGVVLGFGLGVWYGAS